MQQHNDGFHIRTTRVCYCIWHRDAVVAGKPPRKTIHRRTDRRWRRRMRRTRWRTRSHRNALANAGFVPCAGKTNRNQQPTSSARTLFSDVILIVKSLFCAKQVNLNRVHFSNQAMLMGIEQRHTGKILTLPNNTQKVCALQFCNVRNNKFGTIYPLHFCALLWRTTF